MKAYTTWIEIDLNAFTYNLKQVKRWVNKSNILAVVKRDAYGHGALEMTERALGEGVKMLGVAEIEEAIYLRQRGIKTPILVLSGINFGDIEELLEYEVSTVIYSSEIARALNKAAQKKRVKINVHIKIDTGMGRLGIDPQEYPVFLKEIAAYKNLSIEGILTHFACSGRSGKEYTRWQLSRFKEALKSSNSFRNKRPMVHAANSATLIEHPESHLDLVRPGIILYGCYPSEAVEKKIPLRPVMSFKSRIKAIKKVSRGSSIGYERSYTIPQDGLIAVVPVGYADGYSRSLSNKAQVLVKGKRVPVIGNISMDLTIIDISRIRGAEIGEEVVLIGKQGKEEVRAEELAHSMDTIPYEILTSIGNKVPRIFLKNQ
jgi:alanine racemase